MAYWLKIGLCVFALTLPVEAGESEYQQEVYVQHNVPEYMRVSLRF